MIKARRTWVKQKNRQYLFYIIGKDKLLNSSVLNR